MFNENKEDKKEKKKGNDEVRSTSMNGKEGCTDRRKKNRNN